MPRTHTTGKRDANEEALIAEARRLWPDCYVVKMREGQGYDLTIATYSAVLIVEVKRPGVYKLTQCETEARDDVMAAGMRYWIWQTENDVMDTWRYYELTRYENPTR